MVPKRPAALSAYMFSLFCLFVLLFFAFLRSVSCLLRNSTMGNIVSVPTIKQNNYFIYFFNCKRFRCERTTKKKEVVVFAHKFSVVRFEWRLLFCPKWSSQDKITYFIYIWNWSSQHVYRGTPSSIRRKNGLDRNFMAKNKRRKMQATEIHIYSFWWFDLLFHGAWSKGNNVHVLAENPKIAFNRTDDWMSHPHERWMCKWRENDESYLSTFSLKWKNIEYKNKWTIAAHKHQKQSDKHSTAHQIKPKQ